MPIRTRGSPVACLMTTDCPLHQGRRYEQLAELCGEVDESGTVPLALLRNREMKKAIGSVVGLIKVYCKKANEGHPDAIDVSDKLDVAGREQVLTTALFAALVVAAARVQVLTTAARPRPSPHRCSLPRSRCPMTTSRCS